MLWGNRLGTHGLSCCFSKGRHSHHQERPAVATDAEFQKKERYAHLSSSCIFVPIAVETLGAFEVEARGLLKELARRMRQKKNSKMQGVIWGEPERS